MKRLLTILMLCGVYSGYAQETPPHAASAKTWTVGEQVWSDAIHIPECNKETFEESDTAPQCRSYTHEGKTYYYYNWPYVHANAALLCPSPWRAPAEEDFITLAKAFGIEGKFHDSGASYVASNYVQAWGGAYGGYATSTSVSNTGSDASYWSSTKFFLNDALCLTFRLNGAIFSIGIDFQKYGMQVRCVK